MKIATVTMAAALAACMAVPAAACGEKKARAASADAKELAYQCGPGDKAACHFVVEGLKDQENVESVRTALAGVPGVKEAKVDLESGKAYVSCSDPNVKSEALVAAVEKAGFKAIMPLSTKAAKAAAIRN